MGKPDEYYYDYLDDNGRFADQMNGALFQGEQVVSPDELEEELSEVERIIEAQKRVGNYDAGQICAALTR